MTRPPKHPLPITDVEFDQGLQAACLLSDQALYKETKARPSRSYWVRHQGRVLPLKAVLRLAYKLAGQEWGYMQSASAARQLRDRFDIIYISGQSRGGGAGSAGVPTLSPQEVAASRMFGTMLNTVAQSNGQAVERKVKEKLTTLTADEWSALWPAMLEAQQSRCALTGLPLGFDGDCDDPEMLASLDRIDSDGHYTAGNVQIVCRFINRWKCADDNQLVLRLIGTLRAGAGT